MFCDGQCIGKNGKKRCGLYDEYLMKSSSTGKDTIINKCVFKEMVSSLHRLENGSDRLHTAVNSQRNEEVETGHDISKTIANGFLTFFHAANKDPKALPRIKDLKQLSEESNAGTETD